MGIRMPSTIFQSLKQAMKLKPSEHVPKKGHVAVYVGDVEIQKKRRFVVPISYLNHPSFRELLKRSEEEFGFNHPTGGLTIPCREDFFVDLTSHLNASSSYSSSYSSS